MRFTPRLVSMLMLPPLLWAGNAVLGRMLVGSMGSENYKMSPQLRYAFIGFKNSGDSSSVLQFTVELF